MEDGKTLVIVEDEPILLKALNIELLSSGFKIFSASDGQSGLDLIKEKKPQLVLLDLMLPKLNGFEVLRKLKEDAATKDLPVIILSNLSQEEDKKKAMDLGAVNFFVKSDTDLGELVKIIQNILV